MSALQSLRTAGRLACGLMLASALLLGEPNAGKREAGIKAPEGEVLYQGAPRSRVVEALGQPLRSRLTKGGGRIDVYPLGQEAGYTREKGKPKPHGLLEILTFGLWSAVEKPLEQALQGRGKRLVIEYGPDSRVRSFRTTGQGSEHHR